MVVFCFSFFFGGGGGGRGRVNGILGSLLLSVVEEGV